VQVWRRKVMQGTLRFQADIAITVFLIQSHIKTEWSIYDYAIICGGVYLVVPQLILITMSENWRRTLTWFILINLFPFYLASKFEEKYLLNIEIDNDFETFFITKRLIGLFIFYLILITLTMLTAETARHEQHIERLNNSIIQREYK
jgi:hypothetical protein